MDDNKYIGAEGLQELITLTKNELAKKSDIVQFYTMPDPAEYTGKMVQYVGTPGPEDTFKFGHFYFSIWNTWQEIAVQDEDPEKDIICHYKGITTVDSLPSADRSNYSDIYRITDASVYGPPNTHVICSTVQGDGSRYEWRSLGGDIDYFRGLHDPDWQNAYLAVYNDSETTTNHFTCPARGFILFMNSANTKVMINGSYITSGTSATTEVCVPVCKDDDVRFELTLGASSYEYRIMFVPYKVQ